MLLLNLVFILLNKFILEETMIFLKKLLRQNTYKNGICALN